MFSNIDLMEKVVRMLAILPALTFHEFCHGYFAYRMGDPTAYRAGRLTLNPLKHLDPIGTLCLLFAPIGWAKPVPVNALNFHDRRKGILVSTAAGPVSNLVQAVFFGLVLRGVLLLTSGIDTGQNPQTDLFVYLLTLFCYAGVGINVGLAVFNFLPMYPLDGFHVLMQLLPAQVQTKFVETARLGPFMILGLIVLEHATGREILWGMIKPIVRLILQYVTGIPMDGADL